MQTKVELEGDKMTWMEIWQVIYKTLICYVFLLLILRIMGKREVGKISTFDIVVFFVISELFSLSLNEPDASILHSLIPITVIVILQIGSAYVTLKSQKARKIMEGKVTFIIYRGKIQQDEMRKQRYNVEDLMTQIRSKDIQSPEEIEFAILESTGVLNIVTKEDAKLLDPEPLIKDGIIDEEVLKRLGVSKEWVVEQLKDKEIDNTNDVFLALLGKDGLFVVKKELS